MNQFQQPYWDAYQELAGSRQYTQSGIADIPYSEKVKWLDENGVDDPDDRRDYIQMISVLDAAYIKQYYSKEGSDDEVED